MNTNENTNAHQQFGLFSQADEDAAPETPGMSNTAPLAYRLRPNDFADFVGQEEALGRHRLMNKMPSGGVILWGPPGCGKTTLAHLLAHQLGAEMYLFNAVLSGVPELKKLMQRAQETKQFHPEKKIVIFIDEIHRFNKAQQDALLPYVESGAFILFGATTENPRAALNRALLSRVQIVELKALDAGALKTILQRALVLEQKQLGGDILEFLAQHAGGDARKAMLWLENILALDLSSLDQVRAWVLENARAYDKSQDRHYDVISAFIKSMRGSDPQAALLWLAVMLDGGEDPVFIARRMVIFASEDVGNADPQGLVLATSALQAVAQIGMPEARINLAQVVCYLASTVKSNAAYEGINQAMAYVQEHATLEVPNHLRNYPPKGTAPYKYPHAHAQSFVMQQYAPAGTPKFYAPKSVGRESAIKERLEQLWGKD